MTLLLNGRNPLVSVAVTHAYDHHIEARYQANRMLSSDRGVGSKTDRRNSSNDKLWLVGVNVGVDVGSFYCERCTSNWPRVVKFNRDRNRLPVRGEAAWGQGVVVDACNAVGLSNQGSDFHSLSVAHVEVAA
jgi:hypothetical protein